MEFLYGFLTGVGTVTLLFSGSCAIALCIAGKKEDKKRNESLQRKVFTNDMSQIDPKFDSERAYLESQYGLDNYQRGFKKEIAE